MNIMVAGMLGGWEMVLIFGAVLMLFGAKKVPELMGGLGKGIKEFKKATREVTDELQSAMDDNDRRSSAPPAPKALPAATVAHEESATVSVEPATPAPKA